MILKFLILFLLLSLHSDAQTGTSHCGCGWKFDAVHVHAPVLEREAALMETTLRHQTTNKYLGTGMLEKQHKRSAPNTAPKQLVDSATLKICPGHFPLTRLITGGCDILMQNPKGFWSATPTPKVDGWTRGLAFPLASGSLGDLGKSEKTSRNLNKNIEKTIWNLRIGRHWKEDLCPSIFFWFRWKDTTIPRHQFLRSPDGFCGWFSEVVSVSFSSVDD